MLILAIFFVLGLVFGSFLNVVVYRLNLAESVLGRSYCPHCKGQIRWYDNIPLISFILLKFQCRDCKQKISWQYPLIELFTGLVFTLVGYNYFILTDTSTWILTFYYLGIMSFFIAIFVYDFLYLEIPDIILWPAIAWAIVFNLYFDANKANIGGDVLNSSVFSGVLAASIAFAFFFSISVLSREKWMGIGDAYLAILLGLVLGWPQILLGLLLAFTLGASVGLALVFLEKKKLKSQLPFAPFLVVGTIFSLLFYQSIIDWYVNAILF